jgi:hypothetical protein
MRRLVAKLRALVAVLFPPRPPDDGDGGWW